MDAHAGYVEIVEAGVYEATSEVSSTATLDDMASLKETGQALATGAAQPIATNIVLLAACMEALPDMLAGAAAFFSITLHKNMHFPEIRETSLCVVSAYWFANANSCMGPDCWTMFCKISHWLAQSYARQHSGCDLQAR